MTTIKLSVPNISCGHCVNTIQNELGELEGVQSVKADAGSKAVEIVFEAPASEEKLKTALAEINYPAVGFAL
ncbi:MAG: heavy-metal-associated domain-containing protein [Anaerolineales bacterium]|jgi:copper chaperone CopZ|nr:heavy-metal-associated domain-containing protein [Anaerolineales bacterium]